MTEREHDPILIDIGARLILERLAAANVHTWTRQQAREFAALELANSPQFATRVAHELENEKRGEEHGERAARDTIAALKIGALEVARAAAVYREAQNAKPRSSYQIGYMRGYESFIAYAAGITS